jgi:pSer/pThr/pTyr-binding forkhead associated (FHA) protein
VFQKQAHEKQEETMKGELVPIGGGDPIPLLADSLRVGRRESCDVVLRFPNVSAHHCKLELDSGYWYVSDLGSRNGTKVNGKRIETRKRLDPGDRIDVAKHAFECQYVPAELGAVGPPPPDDSNSDVFGGQSLLERAGLTKVKDTRQRYQVTDNKEDEPRSPDDLV